MTNFPQTKDGAIHFEKLINGYMPEEEMPESEYNQTRAKTEMIFPSPPAPKPYSKLVESAFTHIIFVNSDLSTC